MVGEKGVFRSHHLTLSFMSVLGWWVQGPCLGHDTYCVCHGIPVGQTQWKGEVKERLNFNGVCGIFGLLLLMPS